MIIAICGHKFSGKSTVARLLHNATSYPVVSFADKLKDITCILSGCTREDLEDYDFKETQLVPDYLRPYCLNANKPTFRAFLQYFGSEVMRGVNDNIWIDCTLSNASETKGLIISDCRFPNEAKAVKARGGIVIKVVRPDAKAEDSHQSETRIDEIVPDIIIENNSDLKTLQGNVSALVELWKVVGIV
jgi:hypothetical protein